jgi:hypothetical protein
MTVIREADVIASVADPLQYISYYHTPDFIRAMGRAYDMEQSPSARDAIAQILTNSRMCAAGHRPICQDTGIVVLFVKVGMGVRWDALLRSARYAGHGGGEFGRCFRARERTQGMGGQICRNSAGAGVAALPRGDFAGQYLTEQP